jgi:hypothetical protein
MKNSDFLSLNWKDLLKGSFLAALTVISGAVVVSLTATPPHFLTGAEWLETAKYGGAAFVAYLLKNVFSNSDGTPLKKESV